MPKLPNRFRSLRIFVGTAFLSAIFAVLASWVAGVVVFTWGMDQGQLNSESQHFTNLWVVFLLSFASIPAAFLCWPRKRRSLIRMLFAGALTVATSFLLLGWGFSLFMAADDLINHRVMSLDIFSAAMMGPVFLLFGSISTLGVPYMTGLFMASLFADETDANIA